MLLNYILAGFAALFFILCVLSVMAERSPSDKAFPRNLFRRLKITLREIGLLLFVTVAAVLVITALKWDRLDIVWTACSLAAIALGLVILDSFRIFGRARSLRRRKKRKALFWLREVPATKDAPELKEPKDTPLARELPELEIPASAEE
ncbi:MAG: hypothetical protein Q4A05_02390 [Ruminococcus sp.]|nr:hypothetical protein [Ruminococcus sp.]